jgi:hypothetical protein
LTVCGLIISVPATAGEKRENAAVKIDYSRIAFDSAPGRDSFSLAIKAAAGLLGIKAGYAEILALSTNGFAPDLRKDAFLGPWSGKDVKAWTFEVRKREQDIPRARSGSTASQPSKRWAGR